jgi:hypothetical protein
MPARQVLNEGWISGRQIRRVALVLDEPRLAVRGVMTCSTMPRLRGPIIALSSAGWLRSSS